MLQHVCRTPRKHLTTCIWINTSLHDTTDTLGAIWFPGRPSGTAFTKVSMSKRSHAWGLVPCSRSPRQHSGGELTPLQPPVHTGPDWSWTNNTLATLWFPSEAPTGWATATPKQGPLQINDCRNNLVTIDVYIDLNGSPSNSWMPEYCMTQSLTLP